MEHERERSRSPPHRRGGGKEKENYVSEDRKEYFDYLGSHDVGWHEANEIQKKKESFFTQQRIWNNEIPEGQTFFQVNRVIATYLDLCPTKHPVSVRYDLTGGNRKPIPLNPFH